MKKTIVGILLVLVLVPLAFAAGDGAGGLGVFGSWWDSQDYGALYGGGVRLGFEVFSGLALEARVSYLVSEDRDEIVDGRNVSTELELVPLEAAVTWTLDVSESIKPYVGAGAGYYLKNVDWKADDVIAEAEETDSVGYFALAGANVVLGNVVLFGEAKYNLVQDDDEWRWQGSDVEQKNSLDGFAANVGLKLAF
ncbi:MAG: outer membrane beta-barrel protein [Kiritimatiellia bacterium]